MSDNVSETVLCSEGSKCYLCDHTFAVGEGPWLIFDKRVREDGHLECSVARIIAKVLGREVNEASAHSLFLCDNCNAIILNYEELEQRMLELRVRIIHDYNRTALMNNLAPIESIDGLQFDNVRPLDTLVSEDNVHDLNLNDIIEEDSTCSSAGLLGEIEEVDEEQKDAAEFELPQNMEAHNDDMEFLFNSGLDYELANHEFPAALIKYQKDNEYAAEEGRGSVVVKKISQEAEDEEEIEEDNDTPDATLFEAVNLQVSSNSQSDEAEHRSLVEIDHLSLFEQRDNCYICLRCKHFESSDINNLVDHLRTEHNVRIYLCTVCQQLFVRRKDLMEHMYKQHADNGKFNTFNCEACDLTFCNYRQFRLHRRALHSNCKQYECLECNKKYNSQNLLDEHMNMHTGQRPYKCTKCDKTFASKYTLGAHTKIHTKRIRPYQCAECEKAFLNQQNLLQHMKLHAGVKDFACQTCGKAFKTQHNLDVHKIVHSGLRPFICRICCKAFARRAEIKDHERTHTGERPFKCDMCPMAFAQRSNLTSHKKSTHLNEKLHKCNLCDRAFKRRRLLDYHMQAAHTGERPHKCDICGVGFVYPEHYKKHLRVHTGQTPYACEVCGKQFKSRDNRNAHRFVHSDKKPYECLACGAGFMRKPQLLAHMKHTGHSNDTIIVNQPQIHLPVADKEDHNTVNLEEPQHESILMLKPDEPYEPIMQITDHLQNDVAELNEKAESIIVGSVRQFVKDEFGEVKYLQFEDLDKDGQQTITWVDIGETNE